MTSFLIMKKDGNNLKIMYNKSNCVFKEVYLCNIIFIL